MNRKYRKKIIFVALLITIGFSAYSNSLKNEFLWDDELLILNNKNIRGLNCALIFFTKDITHGSIIESNFYRPLQMLTYAFNYAFWGLDRRAYHLTNIFIHICVSLLFYLLVRNLCRDEVLSLISALLFISHPIHTEAVTYISGRADPLACLFILLTVIYYIKYLNNKDKQPLFYFLGLFSFALALLSKEIALVTPLLLVAYDGIYKREWFRKITLKRHLPFFLLGICYVVLRKTILNFSVKKTVVEEVAFFERIPLIFKSLSMYFQKLVVPLNLHMEYALDTPSITDIQVIAGILIASGLILLGVFYGRKERLVSFSIVWFLINFLPVSNIYPLNAFFAEHWIYTPSLGLFILGGWWITKVSEKDKVLKALSYSILVIVVAVNLHLALKQNQYWKTPGEFYKRTLKYAPESPRIYLRLGLLCFRKGELDKAIENTKKSLELSPTYAPAYKNLAYGYMIKGEYDRAIKVCQSGLKIEPDSDILHNDLGVAFAEKKLYNKARMEFEKAISFNPKNGRAYNNLGSILANKGEQEKSIAYFRKAVEFEPHYAQAHYNLARAYYNTGEWKLAIRHFQKAKMLGVKIPGKFSELLNPSIKKGP